MFTNISEFIFNVTLPSSTARDVLEWFEVMRDNNKLANALVGLVHESINADAKIKTAQHLTCSNIQDQSAPAKHEINQEDLLENLYNWQDSNSAVFFEDKNVINKEKKKMLCV